MMSAAMRESASDARAPAQTQSSAKSRSPTVSSAFAVTRGKPRRRATRARSIGQRRPRARPGAEGDHVRALERELNRSAARSSPPTQAPMKKAPLMGCARWRCVYAGRTTSFSFARARRRSRAPAPPASCGASSPPRRERRDGDRAPPGRCASAPCEAAPPRRRARRVRPPRPPCVRPPRPWRWTSPPRRRAGPGARRASARIGLRRRGRCARASSRARRSRRRPPRRSARSSRSDDDQSRRPATSPCPSRRCARSPPSFQERFRSPSLLISPSSLPRFGG